MVTSIQRLTDLVDSKEPFRLKAHELLPLQLDAASERLALQRGTILQVGRRAESVGADAIRDPSDLVPLLFAHTAYKSYPENWLRQGNWDLLGEWLDTVAAYRIAEIDTDNVHGIDEW